MSEDNGDTVLQASKDGLKIAGKKTAELITILSLVVTATLAYAFYKHEEASKDRDVQFIMTLKEMAAATKEGVQVQRVMNCLIALDPKDRQSRVLECERIAR